MQITDNLLAHLRNIGSFGVIFSLPSTLIMTTLSCCLNDSLGIGSEAEFFLDGLRRVGRDVSADAPAPSVLAINRGDFRS